MYYDQFKNSSFVKLKQTKPEAVMKDIEPLLINDELVIGEVLFGFYRVSLLTLAIHNVLCSSTRSVTYCLG